MSAKRRIGFTLVEVLIVVVIMAILAATIIPQFSDSSKDAKESNLRFNLHTLRSQIELYKSQHDGVVPQTANLPELSNKTTLAGDIGNTRTHKFGPYIRQIPANPFTDSQSVVLIAVDPGDDRSSHTKRRLALLSADRRNLDQSRRLRVRVEESKATVGTRLPL